MTPTVCSGVAVALCVVVLGVRWGREGKWRGEVREAERGGGTWRVRGK